MTENEAKLFLEIEKECIHRNCDRNCAQCDIVQKIEDLNSAYDVAIKALKEVQQYRTIGTLEECRVAVEKQTAKKISSAWCPSRKKYLTMQHLKGKYHCVYCGQKLDWSDEE